MKLVVDQPIALSARDAQGVFVDPAFYNELGALAGISAPTLLSFSKAENRARLVLGYRFSGQLSGPAAMLLDTKKLTWAQQTDVDLSSRRTQVRMVPDNYKDFFSFEGWYELRDIDEGNCTQHLEADLIVHVPLLGPLAERAIAMSVRQNLAETAQLVERYGKQGR
ncbi:MAG: DUF2505 family protein [Acidimicrobiales bacterium]